MDVDPVLQKGLGFLISRAPDSAEKLKKLMFETLGREYIAPTASEKKEKAKDAKRETKSGCMDYADADTDVESNAGETMDADDFAFDMGISCLVCRQFDVSPTNQLLECKSCGSLYHQKCHDPAVSSEEANSPAFVWNCNKCSKSNKASSNKKVGMETDSRGSSPKSSKRDKAEGEEKKVKSSSNKDKKSDKRDRMDKTSKFEKSAKSDRSEKTSKSEKSSKSSKERDGEKPEKSAGRLDLSMKDNKSKSDKQAKSDSGKTKSDKHKLSDEKSKKSEEKKSKKAKKDKF